MAIAIPGFTGFEEIHRSKRSLVLRAVRTADGQRVVLKTTADRHPSAAQIASFAREKRLAEKAQGEGVARVLGAIDHEGAPVLVLEDVGGRSLDRETERLPLSDALPLAIAAARAVAAVHARGVIHKDVNPSNLVWNRAAGALVLVDFDIATDLKRESPSRERASFLEGTIQYVAPEQTGRMSATVDRRSDLYSLGATLYELLSGARPFEGEDPLELVHAHVARAPVPLHERAPEVPETLSRVVMRLLEKAPEQRYQTAVGLVADLERCLSGEPFVLGARDRSGIVEVPQRLYGRGGEVRALLASLARAAAGGRELVLVAGAPGIGKTSLVHELQQPIAERRGDLLEGKFDQLRLGVPYAPLGHAFGRFLRWVLTLDDVQVASWRERIGAAVGRNGAVLAAILPELEALLGPQPPVQDLGTAEAENRFHLVFRGLVEAIATESHPIALFLDDLQWADVPTLRLLERIVTDADSKYLMVIGAYRDSEVDAAHPLRITVDNVLRAGVEPVSITLSALGDEQVRRLVEDTFLATRSEVERLAAVCAARTGGNPFFLRRFLEALGEEGIASFDHAAQRWRWDAEAAAALPHTENVVAFLLDRLAGLPERTQAALQHAACIGDTFEIALLADAVEREEEQVQADLRPAVDAELVAPTSPEAARYRFVHDRIHQAAYRSMSEEGARRAHLRLGQRIAARHREEEEGAWRFEVVNHLDKAASLITDPAERASLARRNLDAGKRAMRAAAFGPAFEYFAAGIATLPEDAWEAQYELALELHAEAAECAYANARFDRAAELISVVKAHARALLDRIQALEIEMESRMAQDDLRGAVSVALGALRELGFALPEQPGNDEVGAAFQRAMGVVSKVEIGAIEALPDVADPVVAAAQRILVRASSPSYYVAPALLPIIACELVVTSVERGLSTATPFGLAVFGIVLNSLGMMKEAYAYGALAERLIDRWPDRRLEARTRLVVNNHVCTWIPPLVEKLDHLREAYRIGRDTGDFEYAAIAAQCYATNAFSAGRELGKLLEDAEQLSGFMKNYEQSPSLRLHLPLVQLVKCLRGGVQDPTRLDDAGYDEDGALAFALESGSASLVFVILSDILVARWHFGSAHDALAIADRARPYQPGAASTYHLVNYHTYAPLAASRVHDASPDPALIAKVDESIAQLEVWAGAGPMNHLHRLLMVKAERARISGDVAGAEALYYRALEAVRETSYVNDEALICELTGRFFLARGGVMRTVARAFLEDAAFAYQRWGASKKVERLRAEFPRLLSSLALRRTEGRATTTSELDVDAAAVVRAARAISAEIELDKLLTTLFRTVMEAGGAQKALLLLERGGRWEVAVEGGEPELVEKPLDGLSSAEYPLAVLRFVLRTGEDVVIDDAQEPGSLMHGDAYARSHGTRSVLCVPIRHRGGVSAVLYLEHAGAAGVFTAERSGLTKLLISQASVSIANAQLFEAQVRLTEAQSRFVPHQFLESLEHTDIAEVALGDAVQKTMSVFFSDLRAFTTLVETLEAGTVIQLLNDYFAAMEPNIVDAGGFIDSFNGDQIMALFDVAPEHAVRAGIGMRRSLERFNATSSYQLRMGMGINTGPVVLGTVGGRDRIKCGVVGDAVNVASRIEGLTKRYGAHLLIGEATQAALPSGAFSLRAIDRVAVKGKTRAQTIHEVLDAAPAAERTLKERTRAALERAMALYYARDFRAAARVFAECREAAPEDLVPQLFLERSRTFEEHPPPEDWAGIDRLA